MRARSRATQGADLVAPSVVRSLALNGLALAPAAANVIMQLSRLSIGHAVATSTVASGALTKHPFKRTRTTLGYLLVALLGDDNQRAWMRREVNRQHRHVRSGESAPVAYDAFDPDLQLWVAACMYQGAIDAVTLIDGPPTNDVLDAIYGSCARLATTLQVPSTAWPKDRDAFASYWQSSLEHVAMDDVTRAYLHDVASLAFLPRALRGPFGALHSFLTAGFLPEVFRRELGLTWSDARQRRFDLVVTIASRVHRVLPRIVREFPLNLVWWDTQRRYQRGRPFV